MNLRIISAGAGSGKTYRLTSEMVSLLQAEVRPTGIIATTFTKKAAAELQERVRVRLLEHGLREAADQLAGAMIGTVHGLGVKLLRRFAFEAGVSPEVSIMADEDQQILFNQSLATVLTLERVHQMENLTDRLGLNKRERFDWRKDVMQLSDVARANNFKRPVLEKSKLLSFETFQTYLGNPSNRTEAAWNQQLKDLLETTIEALENGADATKKTQGALAVLKGMKNEIWLRGTLFWHQWVKLSKLDVGAKSRDEVEALQEFAASHDTSRAFQEDIKGYIYLLFDIAMAALDEYAQYKKKRGWIDYTDMEVLVNDLLDQHLIQEVLREELDLLMVDEFQDTSPIQLSIFLKLSQLAKYSVWVGDPKQSIYGFRGADPELMQAIIQEMGGIRPEDIQTDSYRSREDIVFATNAIFTKAFPQLPKEQVALSPKRRRKAGPKTSNKIDEPAEQGLALHHWHFHFDGEGRRLPGKPWMEDCIATTLKRMLDRGLPILPKDEPAYRALLPGDVAVLCRSNRACQEMAAALHRAGLKAAISRAGLLDTAESRLVLACLKYLLNQSDSLSAAEVLFLAGDKQIEAIIEDRLDFLETLEEYAPDQDWAIDDPHLATLNRLREEVVDLSSSEVLSVVLETMDIRRLVSRWGREQQRRSNLDQLARLAIRYEDACNRLHTAASLGGFLLWMLQLQAQGVDHQGAAEAPDSVNVLTYHKSKGLEYPMVLCHDLENTLRGDVWGIELVPEQEQIDLRDVLGNRWLRFWVNPYADQYRNTPLEARIKEGEAQKEATRKALEEEARLLYVGITRARDYLVFPTRPKPSQWLNRVFHRGQEDTPTLDPESHETPWEWEGRFLDIQTETFIYPRTFGQVPPAEQELFFLEERSGRQEYEAFRIDLRKESLNNRAGLQLSNKLSYAHPLEVSGGLARYQTAKALKAWVIGDRLDYTQDLRVDLLEPLLDRFELDWMEEDRDQWLDRSQAFQQLLRQRLLPDSKQEFRKYPVSWMEKGRLFETILDFLLIGEQECVVVQNSGFTGERKQLAGKMQELGDWLFLVQKAVLATQEVKSVRLFVHFVLYGELIEVDFSARSTRTNPAQMGLFD